MSIFKIKNADGELIPVGSPPAIVDWKNILNKPMQIGNSELSTEVEVITLPAGATPNASLVLNKDTNQFELTLFLPVSSGNGEGGGSGGGFSPTIKVTETENGYVFTIVDVNGVNTYELTNGKSAFQIAKQHGYTGEEEDFNKLLGSLNVANFLSKTNITNLINDSEEQVPSAKAVKDYITNEYVILTSYLREEKLEQSENFYIELDENNFSLYEKTLLTNKPMFLFVEELGTIFYYIGMQTFISNLSQTFFSVTITSTQNNKLQTIPYLTEEKITTDIDNSEGEMLPTASAVINYIKKQVSDTVDLNSTLPINSKAVSDYFSSNSEIILLFGKTSINEETGEIKIELDESNKQKLEENLKTAKPIYIYLTDLNICLLYIEEYKFFGYYNNHFVLITFNKDDLFGTFSSIEYITSDKISNSFSDPITSKIPTLQAVLDYFSSYITEEISDTNSLLPTSAAVAAYIENVITKTVIIECEKTLNSSNEIILTLTEKEHQKLFDNSLHNKKVFLVIKDSNLSFDYEENGIFSRFTNNNTLEFVQFNSSNLFAKLETINLLTDSIIAKTIDSDENSVPTLKIIKDYVQSNNANITINKATTSSDGLLSKEDKAKLDTIQKNANYYIHPEKHEIYEIKDLSTNLTNLNNQIKTLNDNKIDFNTVGAANGVAKLDENSKILISQLPDFLSTSITEGYYNSDEDKFYEDEDFTILIEPKIGNYYVDKKTKKSYRYSGSSFISQASDDVNIRELTKEEINEILNLNNDGGI